jgi:hypothetical protein
MRQLCISANLAHCKNTFAAVNALAGTFGNVLTRVTFQVKLGVFPEPK